MFKDVLLCGAGLTAIFIIPAIVVGLMWWRARRRETAAAEAWLQLADDLSLSYEPKRNFLGIPVAGSLHGQYRGRSVLLTSIREAPRLREEKWFFGLTIGLEAYQVGKLTLIRKGTFTKLASFVRGNAVAIDDPRFDEIFVVTSDFADGARNVFSSASLREKLTDSPIKSFEVREDRIETVFPPKTYDLQHWRTVLDILSDVAEAVEGSTSTADELG
jgi:hypothetical protein